MDFHSMKRAELQALCKKHNIPANLKNIEMANRLASLLKIDDGKPQEQQLKPCLKGLDDDRIKEAKKVRISPLNQTFEFEKTNPRAMRLAYRTRKSMAIEGIMNNEEKVSASEYSVPCLEKASENVSVDKQVKSTRTKGRKPKQAKVVEAELPPKKKAEENEVSKRTTRKRTSCVADLVAGRPEKSKQAVAEAELPPKKKAEENEVSKRTTRKRTSCVADLVAGRPEKSEQAEVVEAELLPKKKAEENEVSKRTTRKRTSCVADLVAGRPEKSVKNKASEAKPVARRSARNAEKPVDSVEQVEIVKVPKRKTRSECLVNKGEEKAPTRNLRRNISKDTGEKTVEEANEEGKEKAKVTRNTRRQTRGTRLNETVSATESASVVEQSQRRRSIATKTAATKTDKVEPEELNDKKSEAEVQEKGVSLRDKQPRKQGKSSKPGNSDVQTKCVGKRKMSTIKRADDLQADPSCNEIVVIPDDEGKNQPLDQTTIAAEKDVHSVREEEYDEEEILNGDSSEDAQIVLVPSSGFKSPRAVSIVSRSSAEDSKAKLENSPSKVDSSVQSDTPLTSTSIHKFTGISLPMCEPGFQGIYEVQHEAVTPRSLVAECEPNDGEVSSLKSTKLEDRICADTILCNEQVPFTWTTGTMNSAATRENKSGISKEEGVNADFCLIEGQFSRDDIADFSAIDSGLHKFSDTPATSTMVSNEPVEPQTDKCIDQVGTHECTNVGYIQDKEEVTPRAIIDEKIEASEGNDTCISDRSPDPTEEDGNSQTTIHEETIVNATENDIAELNNEPALMNMPASELNDNHEIVLVPSSCFKSPRAVSTLSRSSAEDSKAKLENSASKSDSCLQSDTPLTRTSIHKFTGISLPMSELRFQGIYEVQHEAATPRSFIAECKQNDGEVSSIKSTKLEDRLCADTMLSNEQVQYTWTTGIVESAATKENKSGISKADGIDSDLCLMEGQIMRNVIADLNGIQSGLHKLADTLATSTMASNEPVDSQTDKCIEHVGTHESGENAGYNEKIETSEGDDTCISERPADPIECEENYKQGLGEESNSRTILEETNGSATENDSAVINNEPELMNMTDAQLNENHEDAVLADQNLEGNNVGNVLGLEEVIPSAMIADCEGSHKQGLDEATSAMVADCEGSHKQGLEEAKSQLASVEETYDIESLFQAEYAEDDIVVIDNGLEVRNFVEVSIAELNNNHEEAVLANQNLEVHKEKAGSIVGSRKQELEDDTADCERSHRQELDGANSESTSGEETYGIASLFQSEYAEGINNELKGRNLIDVSDLELNNNHQDAVLSDPNKELKWESCREAHEVSGRVDDEAVCMEEADLTGLQENSTPHDPSCSFIDGNSAIMVHSTSPSPCYNSDSEMELVSDLKKCGEFYSARYNDNLVPQQNSMALNDDSLLDGAKQSDHQHFTEMYSWSTEPISMQGCGHMNHTESVSRIFEDESRKSKDDFTPNVHLLLPSQSEQADAGCNVTQEDCGKVASFVKEIVAVASEANSEPTQDGVTTNSDPSPADDLMDWEDYGSDSKNKAALIVLHGPEEKSAIQSSVEEANINDENADYEESRATVEPIATSPEVLHSVDSANQTEPEDDLIGLVVLERVAEQTEQGSGENFSLTSEPQEGDGESFSLAPYPEEADGEKFSLSEPEEADGEKLSLHEPEKVGREKFSLPEPKEADGENFSLASEPEETFGGKFSLPEPEEADGEKFSAPEPNEVNGEFSHPEPEETVDASLPEEGANMNGYNDNFAPQRSVMILNDDALIGEAGQSDQQHFTEMCTVSTEPITMQGCGHMVQTESDSLTSESQEGDGENFSLAPPKPEEADGENFLLASKPEESVGEFSISEPEEADGEKFSLEEANMHENTESKEHPRQETDIHTFSYLRSRVNTKMEGMVEVTTNIEHLLEEQIKQAREFSRKLEEDISDIRLEDLPKDDECKSTTVIKGISKEGEIASSPEMKMPVDNEAEVENSSRKPNSVMNTKKRRILIHGTPRRPIKAADMKENSTSHLKRELHLGDATAMRPIARKALGELHRR